MADEENQDLAPEITPVAPDEEELQQQEEDDSAPSASIVPPSRKASVPSWQDISSDPRFKKASTEQKGQLLNNWTSSVLQQAQQIPGYKPEDYKKIADFSDAQRSKLGDSGAKKVADWAYETVKGVIPFAVGGAETSAELGLGVGAEALRVGEEKLGIQPGQTVNALADQSIELKDALISKTKSYAKNLEAYVPDENGKVAKAETRGILDALKKHVDSGDTNADFIKTISGDLQKSVANQYGEDVKDYANDPLRTLTSPENLKLLDAYKATRDPVYFEHLKQNLTASNEAKEAQQDVNTLLGKNDYWKSIVGNNAVGESLDNARAASANPLTLPSLLIPGGAAGGSLVKKLVTSGAAGSAVGAGQEVLENSNATLESVAKAAATTGGTFALLGGAHDILGKLKSGIRNDQTAQALAPASAKAAEANVAATQAEIPGPEVTKSLDQAQGDLAKETLTKLQNKEINQEQYNSILKRIDDAKNTESVDKISQEVNAPQVTEASVTEIPEPIAGADEAIKSVDENKDILPQHSQDAYKELIAEATTPEEVKALQEKINEEVKPVEEAKISPKEEVSAVVEEKPIGEGTTLTAEIAKRIESGEDVSGFSPEDLRSAKELVDSKKEAKQVDEKTAPETRAKEAKGKSEKTGEIKLNENSERYATKIAETKDTASPENVEMAEQRLANEQKKFDGQKKRIEKELSGYKNIPGGEDAAQQIIDAAKNKHYLNTLQGKASDPSMVLKNVTRDFIRKAEVLKKKGESQVSTETPIAEAQTVGDTLSKASGNEAEANDTRKVAKDVLAEVLPGLKDNEKTAIKTVQEGGTVASKDLVPALIKLRRALKKKGLDETEVDDAVDRITRNDLEPTAAPVPNKESKTEKEGPSLVDPIRKLDDLDTKIETAKSNQLVKKFKDEQVGKQFAKLIPDLRKLGIYANDIQILDKPINEGGSALGILPLDNGKLVLQIHPESLEKLYKSFENSGFAEFAQNEELKHAADFTALRGIANEFGYKSFYKFLNDIAPVVLEEAKGLQSDLPGLSLADRSASVYSPGVLIPEVNRMMEFLRQIGQARATGSITEALIRGPYNTIRNFVKRLLDVFKTLESTSYTRYIVENSERLLGQKPLDLLPLDPLESNMTPNEIIAVVGTPAPNQVETPEFKKWFGNSKVVDETGEPLKVYHGTLNRTINPEGKHVDFTEFKNRAFNRNLDGFFFSDNPDIASEYAGVDKKEDYIAPGGVVKPVFVKLENPLIVDRKGQSFQGQNKYIKEAQDAGNDGLIFKNVMDMGSDKPQTQYVAFRPEQIKSAIGNSGAFDPNNPSIIAAPTPNGGYPESPLGKLTREVRENQASTVAEKTLGERMDEVGKKLSDTVTSTKTTLDKTARALRNNIGNWSVFKDAMSDHVSGIHKVNDYDTATNKWNTADQKRLSAIEEFHKQLSAEFPKERLEAMSIFADAGSLEKVNEGLKWFNEPPTRREGESAIDFNKRENIWKDAQKYKAAYEAAANLSPRELDVHQQVNQYLDQALIDGQQNNILRQGIEDYFTHIWERDGKVSKQVSGELNSGKLQTYFRFARERKYPKFLDGIQNGEHPKTLNLADIVSVYDNSMRKAVASRGYVRDLTQADSGFVDEEGKSLPVAAPGGIGKVIGAEGADPRLFIKAGGAPIPGYIPIDHPSFKGHKYIGKDTAGNPVVYESDLWVHPDYAKKIENNISSKSWLRQFALGRGALKVQQIGKANMLSFPFFHIAQEGYHVTGHLENPLKGIGATIDYENPRTTYWMEHGLQLRDVDGQQNFYQDLGPALLHRVPVAGKRLQAITDWTFKIQIPKYKEITAEATLARDIKRFAPELESGKVTIDDLAYHASQVANSAYGGLNYRLIGRSRTAQDFMKLFLLAPDFLEARARFAGSALRGLTGAKADRENLMAFALLGFSSWLGARVLNKISTDDYHFDKPFSVIIGNKEYRQRTVVSDAVEAFSSLIPGLNEPQGSWRFAFDRFSPFGQLGWGIAGVGNEAVHGNAEVAKEQFKKQLFDLATTPIPLGVKGPLLAEIPREYRPSGEFMQTIPEALTSTFGVTARSYTNAGEIQKKANRFVSEQPNQKTQASFPASPYTDLRTFLRKDDLELAKKELAALEADGTDFDKIYKAFKKASNAPFTHDNKLEPKFLATLDDKEKQQYQDAHKEKRDDLQQLLKLQGEIQAEKNK